MSSVNSSSNSIVRPVIQTLFFSPHPEHGRVTGYTSIRAMATTVASYPISSGKENNDSGNNDDDGRFISTISVDALNLDIFKVQVVKQRNHEEISAKGSFLIHTFSPAEIAFDAKNETVTFRLPRAMRLDSHRQFGDEDTLELRVWFSASIQRVRPGARSEGFFFAHRDDDTDDESDDDDDDDNNDNRDHTSAPGDAQEEEEEGEEEERRAKKRLYGRLWRITTQLEPCNARRIAPFIKDEPHLRCQFNVHVVTPQDILALGNGIAENVMQRNRRGRRDNNDGDEDAEDITTTTKARNAAFSPPPLSQILFSTESWVAQQIFAPELQQQDAAATALAAATANLGSAASASAETATTSSVTSEFAESMRDFLSCPGGKCFFTPGASSFVVGHNSPARLRGILATVATTPPEISASECSLILRCKCRKSVDEREPQQLSSESSSDNRIVYSFLADATIPPHILAVVTVKKSSACFLRDVIPSRSVKSYVLPALDSVGRGRVPLADDFDFSSPSSARGRLKGRLLEKTLEAPPLPVCVLIPCGRKKEIGQFALDTAIAAVRFLEDTMRQPFPSSCLQLVTAGPAFSSLGMENWNLITFAKGHLYVDDTTDIERCQRICRLIAHEVSHQFFGNSSSVMSFAETWLKEGQVRFLEYCFVQRMFPQWNLMGAFYSTITADCCALDRLAFPDQQRTVAIPASVPQRDIMAHFNGTVYGKGGSILRMLHDMIGAQVYNDGLARLICRFQWTHFTSADLAACLVEACRARGVPTSFEVVVGREEQKKNTATNGSNEMMSIEEVLTHYTSKLRGHAGLQLAEVKPCGCCKVSLSASLPSAPPDVLLYVPVVLAPSGSIALWSARTTSVFSVCPEHEKQQQDCNTICIKHLYAVGPFRFSLASSSIAALMLVQGLRAVAAQWEAPHIVNIALMLPAEFAELKRLGAQLVMAKSSSAHDADGASDPRVEDLANKVRAIVEQQQQQPSHASLLLAWMEQAEAEAATSNPTATTGAVTLLPLDTTESLVNSLWNLSETLRTAVDAASPLYKRGAAVIHRAACALLRLKMPSLVVEDSCDLTPSRWAAASEPPRRGGDDIRKFVRAWTAENHLPNTLARKIVSLFISLVPASSPLKLTAACWREYAARSIADLILVTDDDRTAPSFVEKMIAIKPALLIAAADTSSSVIVDAVQRILNGMAHKTSNPVKFLSLHGTTLASSVVEQLLHLAELPGADLNLATALLNAALLQPEQVRAGSADEASKDDVAAAPKPLSAAEVVEVVGAKNSRLSLPALLGIRAALVGVHGRTQDGTARLISHFYARSEVFRSFLVSARSGYLVQVAAFCARHIASKAPHALIAGDKDTTGQQYQALFCKWIETYLG